MVSRLIRFSDCGIPSRLWKRFLEMDVVFASLPLYFWADAIAVACYTQNWSLLNKRFTITPYGILNIRKPNIKFFHVFSSRCFIFNSKENRNQFDVKADEGIFLRYSLTSKSYMVLNIGSGEIV